MRKSKILALTILISTLMVSFVFADQWAVIRRGHKPCQVIKVVGTEKVLGIVAGPFATKAEAIKRMKAADMCKPGGFNYKDERVH
jgi:hypothetical protein